MLLLLLLLEARLLPPVMVVKALYLEGMVREGVRGVWWGCLAQDCGSPHLQHCGVSVQHLRLLLVLLLRLLLLLLPVMWLVGGCVWLLLAVHVLLCVGVVMASLLRGLLVCLEVDGRLQQ